MNVTLYLLYLNFISYYSEISYWPEGLTILLTASFMATGAWDGLVRSLQAGKRNKLNQALHAHFSFYEIEQAIQYFIPTRYKNIIAHNSKERVNGSQPKENLLIPFFMEYAFEGKIPKARFFVVMGEAGSGKTSFILNLFHQYASQKSEKLHVVLLSFNNPEVVDRIDKMKNQSSTILLLDAFDVDPQANKDYQNRLKEIYEKSVNFKYVLITCRNNFFSEAFYTPIQTFFEGFVEAGREELICIQLSDFNDKEIGKYLRKKYPIWDFGKRNQLTYAKQHIPTLIKQPLILSYLDELKENNPKLRFSFNFEIFEALVNQWIEKELQYYPELEQDTFRIALFNFLKAVARSMYDRQKAGKGLFLPKEKMYEIAKAFNIQLESATIDNRSLLNYSANWDYKFAHKSILEYLLAREALKDKNFGSQLPLRGMDQGMKFVNELFISEHFIKVPGGNMRLAGDEGDNNRDAIAIEKFFMSKYPVDVASFRLYCESTGREMPKAPSWGWEDDAPMVNVNWQTAKSYCDWLGKRMGANIRLPKEIEWEYAARGGKNREWEYAGSDEINDVAWYNKNASRRTHPLGQKKPNELGLYDMSGHVWEWCENLYEESLGQEGNEEVESAKYAIRGGSWLNHENPCRVSNRAFSLANKESITIGFRIVIIEKKK